MNIDKGLELIYEQILEDSFKGKLAATALGAAALFGGIDQAYSPKLPEPTEQISADQVVQKALSVEKSFILNQVQDGNFFSNAKDFLKSYNQVKRNLKRIEDYSKEHNVRLNYQKLISINEKLDKLKELSSFLRWDKMDTIYNKIKSLFKKDDFSYALSEALKGVPRADAIYQFVTITSDVYSEMQEL